MAPSIVQVAISLMLAGSTWASSNSHVVVLEKRAPPVVPSVLPGTWTYQGCYTDGGPRTLSGQTYASATNMTDAYCIGFCEQNGYIYAGTEYSSECCKSFYQLDPYRIDRLTQCFPRLWKCHCTIRCSCVKHRLFYGMLWKQY